MTKRLEKLRVLLASSLIASVGLAMDRGTCRKPVSQQCKVPDMQSHLWAGKGGEEGGGHYGSKRSQEPAQVGS